MIIVTSILIGVLCFITGAFIGIRIASKIEVRKILNGWGLTHNSRHLLREARLIIGWLSSDDVALRGVVFTEDERLRMEKFVNNYHKEFK